jgi:hypothetical protein
MLDSLITTVDARHIRTAPTHCCLPSVALIALCAGSLRFREGSFRRRRWLRRAARDDYHPDTLRQALNPEILQQ